MKKKNGKIENKEKEKEEGVEKEVKKEEGEEKEVEKEEKERWM